MWLLQVYGLLIRFVRSRWLDIGEDHSFTFTDRDATKGHYPAISNKKLECGFIFGRFQFCLTRGMKICFEHISLPRNFQK